MREPQIYKEWEQYQDHRLRTVSRINYWWCGGGLKHFYGQPTTLGPDVTLNTEKNIKIRFA